MTKTKTAMPRWLRQALINNGTLSLLSMSRRAHIQRCKRCNLPILIGLDNDMCAMAAHADLAELTPIGEAYAILENRRTYEVRQLGQRIELTYRHWNPHWPPKPASHERPVVCDHDCGTPIPPKWRLPARPAQETKPPLFPPVIRNGIEWPF